MSELQIGLLAIRGLVVIGVLGYSRIQERGAKRAAERLPFAARGCAVRCACAGT
jgi:hypothetical protein